MMGISVTRTVEGRRDSDGKLIFVLDTPEEDELGGGHTLALEFRHDAGDGEETILLSDEEARLLHDALDDWIFGV
jgi:hypothetical protein